LVTEYHCKGSLGQQLERLNKRKKPGHQSKGLNIEKVRLYLIDILKALYYCHKIIKVIHRDIKPDNIMVNHNEEAVIIDFGVSALVDT
jgi:serine/threonine protein kinase